MKLAPMSWVKLTLFCLIGLMCGVLVVNTLSMPVRGPSAEYVAQFSSVEGLNAGNPVMMNGIRVGRVDSIRFADNGNGTARADVSLRLRADVSLSTNVTAAVRYGDMLGARYVALSDPGGAIIAVSTDGESARLSPGDPIALAQTTPAVDLTALFNGFKPLFDALAPDQVNALTRGFVETFAGQEQSVSTLLAQIAAMSASMGGNAELFSTVLNNLSTTMASVDARRPELQQMLAGLHRLTATVNGPDGQLDLMLDQSNAVLSTLAATVASSGQTYGAAIGDLNALLATWEDSTPEFTGFLERLPQFSDAINRSTSYGGFVSLYLCNFTLKIAKHEANIFGSRHSEVCLP